MRLCQKVIPSRQNRFSNQNGNKIFVHYLYIIACYHWKCRKFTLWQLHDTKLSYVTDPLILSKTVYFHKLPYIFRDYPVEPFITLRFDCNSEFSLLNSNAVVKRIVLFCLNIRLDNCYENIVTRISQNVYPQEDLSEVHLTELQEALTRISYRLNFKNFERLLTPWDTVFLC